MDKRIKIFFGIIFLLIFSLFFIRFLSPSELDDVHLEIFCEKELLDKSDVLWVIPKFNGEAISENKEWCEDILGLNKTLGMHGVYHSLNEFVEERNQEYLEEGIEIFENCFGFKPELFKPPQLRISKENKELILDNNLEFGGKANQVFHKVYHCDNSGFFSNKLIDLF